MEDKGENLKENKKKSNYEVFRPVLIFYAKTTSWIILPLVAGLIVKKYFTPQLSLVIMLVAFLITCYGIYREIKQYKQELAKENKNDSK